MKTGVTALPAVAITSLPALEPTWGYFDARRTHPGPSSLQRDLCPMSALDQHFAYYEA